MIKIVIELGVNGWIKKVRLNWRIEKCIGFCVSFWMLVSRCGKLIEFLYYYEIR